MNFTLPDDSSKELIVAIEASIAAAEISKKYFNGSFEVSIKDDMTPLTEVDIECEKVIKKILLSSFPDHGFFGEETAQKNKDADFYGWSILLMVQKVLLEVTPSFQRKLHSCIKVK